MFRYMYVNVMFRYKLGFGSKMSQVIYWLYGSSTSSCIIDGELTDSWSLAKSV